MKNNNSRDIVGKVTMAERDEIKALHERKNALLELFQTIKDINQEDDALYERIVADMGRTTTKFNDWWDNKSRAYSWQTATGQKLEIDFNTCEVFLAK